MFSLKDLMGDAVKGRFYSQQLRSAPSPGVNFQFEVILKSARCVLCYMFHLDAVQKIKIVMRN